MKANPHLISIRPPARFLDKDRLDAHDDGARESPLRPLQRTDVPALEPALLRAARPTQRILVVTDFSLEAEAAFALALHLAKRTAAAVILAHVLDAFHELFETTGSALAHEPDEALSVVDAALRARAEAARHRGVPVRTASLVGAPALEVARCTRRVRPGLLLLPLADDSAPARRAGATERHWLHIVDHVDPALTLLGLGPQVALWRAGLAGGAPRVLNRGRSV